LPLERVITSDDLDRGELAVALEKGGGLRLRIVSAEGKPVPGALVTAFQSDADGGATRRLRTISIGEVHFENLRPGDYTVIATTNQDGEALARGIAVAAGDSPETREIALERGEGSITIKVVAHDGSALPLCAVRLTPSDATRGDGLYRDGVTDESGTCRFAALPVATWDIEVGGRKFTRRREAAVPADGREVVLRVDQPGSIAGRVELTQVKEGYAIRVSGSRNTGGESSPYERTVRFSAFRRDFTLRDVPAGTYTLDLVIDGETAATVEGIEVAPGEKTDGVTFRESGSCGRRKARPIASHSGIS
ncbi:MAG: carboxypeptidase-like regulatory domain-containing protein, partial [Candidatus Binatia bacterium]